MKKKNKFKPIEPEYRINDQITTEQVRIVGEGVVTGIYNTSKALEIAEDAGADLVEIASNNNLPICKVMNFSKFRYKQQKKQKEIMAKSHKFVVKEIRFGPNTDDHDLAFKSRQAENFLKENNKVRIYIFFQGRNIVYRDRGENMLLDFARRLEKYGKLEQEPQLEGRKMIIMLSPKKNN